jgi:hypothetical protein
MTVAPRRPRDERLMRREMETDEADTAPETEEGGRLERDREQMATLGEEEARR